MRLLLTSPSMQVGGAEQVLAMLAAGLAARGHEVGVAAPPGIRDADLAGVPHTRLPLGDRGRSPVGAARAAGQLAAAIRGFGPELVHAQNVKSSVTARLAGATARPARRPPVLATFHGVLPLEYQRAAWLLRSADHTVCVSSDLRESIVAAGLSARRTSLVRNAVTPAPPLSAEKRAELDRELGIGDAPVVAIVGRLVPQKAHQRFVVAARRVAEAMPQARFLIVGDGARRAEIEHLLAAAELRQQVLMTGARADARALIARADLLVFSSDWEGLSIAALEALAAGTPVVSTDVQGMRELLLRSGAGEVVRRDDGTALGERITNLLGDPGRREAMGAAGLALIDAEYSIEAMIDAYEDRYERLLRTAAR